MSLWDPAEFTHMALRLVPEILDPVDVIPLLGKELGVVDPEVFKVRHIQHVVTPLEQIPSKFRRIRRF